MSYEQVTVADGKYTVQIGVGVHAGQLNALRHNEPWQDLTGNNLVYWLAVELRNARVELDALKQRVADAAGWSGDPSTQDYATTVHAPAEVDALGVLVEAIRQWRASDADDTEACVRMWRAVQPIVEGHLQPKGTDEDQLGEARGMVRQWLHSGGAEFPLKNAIELLLSAASQAPAVKADDPGFDECVASGQSCSYGPHGRKGEMQCRYCGKGQEPVHPVTLDQLHTFLNAAAGEGYVLDGVDAAELYVELFPKRYAAAVAQIDTGAADASHPPVQGSES